MKYARNVTRNARATGVLVVLLAAAWPGPPLATAQTADQAAEELRDQASDRYREGRQLLSEGRPLEALQELAASYQLYPSWASLYGMAMCQEALGRVALAADLYDQALREGGEDIPAEEQQLMRDTVRELRAQAGETGPRATGTLAIDSSPPGATILVDGEPAGPSPLQTELTPGTHRVTARMDGYESQQQDVSIDAAITTAIRFALNPYSGGEAAFLAIRVDGPAEVFVDGARVGAAPIGPIEVSPGVHEVRVEGENERLWKDAVAVPAGRRMTVDVRLSGSEGIDSAWFWVLAGTAGAFAVGTIATGSYVLALKDEFDSATLARQDEIASLGDPLRLVTDVLLGVAAASAATAITLAFFTDFSGDEPTVEMNIEERSGGAATAAGPVPILSW
jgi:hypothetical protein